MLITGAGGMVGRAVSDYCRSIGDQVFSYNHQGLDISAPDLILDTFKQDKPDAVVNCAAWTDVDGCELDHERAFSANARGQRDQPNPQSVYGASKLEGERRAQSSYARTIIVRTGFVFGPGGQNFLSTIVERGRRGEKLKAIADAYGTPTYSRDLAMRLRELAQLDLPGTFHVVNAGAGVSYEVFARAALDLGGYSAMNLQSVATSSLQRPAPRPSNSRLRCLLSEAIGLTPLPFWKDSLRDFVALASRSELAAQS